MMLEVFGNIFCAFFGTIGYALLYNVQKKYYIGCGATGTAGWMTYLLMKEILKVSVSTASFFGALVVVLIARMLTVRMKCPITIFLISGIFPLVPGAGIYNTVYCIVTNQFSLAALKGLESLKIVFAIVLGIAIIVPIPRDVFQIDYWKKRWRRKVEANN